MTARVPSGSACTVSRRERTLIVSRLPTCSADLLECCARNARGSFGLTQTIPRGATVGVRLHRVNVTFRRPTSGLTQVATANPASMADGVTFFNRFRDLTATGFWSSQIGVKDLKYQGNLFAPDWNGCPPAALHKLGVTYAKFDRAKLRLTPD